MVFSLSTMKQGDNRFGGTQLSVCLFDPFDPFDLLP